MSNLPAFFQNAGTTVVDELLDFELGGLGEEEDAVDGQNVETFADDDETFGEGDGATELPAFFQNPRSTEDVGQVAAPPLPTEGKVDVTDLLRKITFKDKRK
jgi:hypothetical protein